MSGSSPTIEKQLCKSLIPAQLDIRKLIIGDLEEEEKEEVKPEN